MKKLCVSYDILPTREATAAEETAFAKKAGFDEFDLDLRVKELLEEDYEALFAAKAEAAEKGGMKIRYVHLPFSYPAADDAESWEFFRIASLRGMDVAKMLGAEAAAIHPRTSMREDYDHDKEAENALEFLKPYADYAHKVGLTLGLENMRGAGRSAPARIRRYATDVNDLLYLADSLSIGVTWDTGHANISMQDQEKSLEKVGSLLVLVHLNDNFGEDDIHLAPFLGNIGWNGVMKTLKKIGYRGSLNMEVTTSRRPAPLRASYAVYMNESLREPRRIYEEA
ncbi:MAG: sugar phosphate isomerase/epimerase [Clostridia bacterium]|nr:sugar phosphate isomerase/epimerase [Clostridia bacterium]